MKEIIYSKEEINFLKLNYNKNGRAWCAQKLNKGISLRSLSTKAKSLGLKSPSGAICKRRINIDRTLNTEIGAYILGFLWADGNIKKDYHVVRCNIKESDFMEILPLFNYLGKWSIYRFNKKDGQTQGSAEVHDKYFYNMLKENDYGEKSLASPKKILSIIPNKNHHYFWRGFFDGDGCWHVGGYNNYNKIASFGGSYEQDWFCLTKELKKNNINFNIRRKIIYKTGHKNSTVIICGYENLLKLGSYLYSGNKLGFCRKLNKFKKIIDIADKYSSIIPVRKIERQNGFKFTTGIKIDKKFIHIGTFENYEDAKNAYLNSKYYKMSNKFTIKNLVKDIQQILSAAESRQAANNDPHITNIG